MIVNDAEFLEIVEQEKYVNDPAIQEQLFWHALSPVSIKNLKVLWLIQECHQVSFSHLLLESPYVEHASIDELLSALSTFRIKPTSFVERVLEKGSSRQIEELNIILEGLVNE